MLILMPAAVLVLLILGAICVDFSVAYLAQRQLKDAAVAAVNDAAGAALDEGTLRGPGGATVIDPARAAAVADQAVAASLGGPVRLTAPPAVTVAANRVTVVLDGEVRYVFAPAVPGAPRTAHVRAAASAVLQRGG
jgi:Flp pilus assembly protein TadG